LRLRARTDSNHGGIIKALRQHGMKVQSLAQIGNGVPDLLVGFRGCNVLLEIKDGDKVPSKQILTDAERSWITTWSGQVSVVTNWEEAVNAVLHEAKLRGQV
jgi:hypothetical protein